MDDLEGRKVENRPRHARPLPRSLSDSKPLMRGDGDSAKDHNVSRLARNQHRWRVGAVRREARANKALQRGHLEDAQTFSSTSSRLPGFASSQSLVQRHLGPPGRPLNPSAIQAPLVNEKTYPLLQAAREWSVQANMLKNRAVNESLGDSWWGEQLQTAVQSPYLMHALLATGGSFAAVRTKSNNQSMLLFHNIQSMSLLRQQLVAHKSTLSTLQTLMLLTAFEFYLGNSRAATAHVRAAGQIVKDLGGFQNVPWASKTFLISALVAISTKLKELPILPIDDWDEGPLDSQPWMEPQLEYSLAVASIAGSVWSQSSSSSSTAPCCSWRQWLSPTKQMFSLLEYVQEQNPSSQPKSARIMQWIHNRRFVIKARLFEEYVKLIETPHATLSRGGRVHRTLEACACLATTFCQSLIMFDVPQFLLIHEPRQQLRGLISEVYDSAVCYGSELDHEILLWVAFIGAASEITLNPTVVKGKTDREQMWFSCTFLECIQDLKVSKEDLPGIFGHFIWHEDRFAPHLKALCALAVSPGLESMG